MTIRSDKDEMAAIWVLGRLGWSYRRIARLCLPTSHHTIKSCYEKGCELFEAGKLPVFAKDEKKLRIIYAGNTNDLDYLEGKAHHNECGGGKRIRPHNYNSDLRENSHDD